MAMTSFTLLQGRDMEIEYKKKIKHAVEPTAIQHSISNIHMKCQRRGVQISYFELLGKDKKEVENHGSCFIFRHANWTSSFQHKGRSILRTNKIKTQT